MKKKIFSGILFCNFIVIFLFLGCANTEEKKNAHFQKGMEYQEKGDNNAAIRNVPLPATNWPLHILKAVT